VFLVRVSTPTADVWGARELMSWVTWLEARACRRAAGVIAHSESIKEKSHAYYGCPREKVKVIPLGIPDVQPAGEAPRGDLLELLYLGRAEERKGTDLLLRALLRTLSARRDFRIRLVGADMEAYLVGRPDLRPVWAELQGRYPGHVVTTGRVTDAERDRLLASSHWLLVPSRYESFGLMAVEAMRAGTPVIAAAAGGLVEVCDKCAANRLFPAGDEGGLYREINVALDQGLGSACAARVQARQAYLRYFSADRMIDESLDYYRAALRALHAHRLTDS
jgi:glycogen(starch) synthase